VVVAVGVGVLGINQLVQVEADSAQPNKINKMPMPAAPAISQPVEKGRFSWPLRRIKGGGSVLVVLDDARVGLLATKDGAGMVGKVSTVGLGSTRSVGCDSPAAKLGCSMRWVGCTSLSNAGAGICTVAARDESAPESTAGVGMAWIVSSAGDSLMLFYPGGG
jgi:hypothetical protein